MSLSIKLNLVEKPKNVFVHFIDPVCQGVNLYWPSLIDPYDFLIGYLYKWLIWWWAEFRSANFINISSTDLHLNSFFWWGWTLKNDLKSSHDYAKLLWPCITALLYSFESYIADMSSFDQDDCFLKKSRRSRFALIMQAIILDGGYRCLRRFRNSMKSAIQVETFARSLESVHQKSN